MNRLKKYFSAHKMGIKTIHDSDVFVASYPKSGNTWLRFLIANMITKKELITFKNINNYVPGIYSFRETINQMNEQRYIKIHDPFFEMFPRCIYIYRDYRDVLVSYFHFQVNQQQFSGTISDFIKSKNVNHFGKWSDHVLAAIKQRQKHPDKILMIGYEHLMEQPVLYAKQIADFCKIEPQRSWNEIVSNCSFEHLQQMEEEHGKVFDKLDFKFFRSGTKKQWKDALTKEDIAYIMKENEEFLTQLGYETT
jgi:hypothetical protein